jgi:hypothetical protein
MVVTVARKAALGKSNSFLITATSASDMTKQDTVGASVTVN